MYPKALLTFTYEVVFRVPDLSDKWNDQETSVNETERSQLTYSVARKFVWISVFFSSVSLWIVSLFQIVEKIFT